MNQVVGRILAVLIALLPGIAYMPRWWLVATALVLLFLAETYAAVKIVPGGRNFKLQLYARIANAIALALAFVFLLFRLSPLNEDYGYFLVATFVPDLVERLLEAKNRIALERPARVVEGG